MNFFPSYLNPSAFRLGYVRRLKVHDVEFVFQVMIRPSEGYVLDPKTYWCGLRTYLMKVLPFIVGRSKRRFDTINIGVFEDTTPKRLPRRKGSSLTPDHVNSGLTYLNGEYGGVRILLYRVEEMEKVLCHELIHLYEAVEINDPKFQTINLMWQKEFGVDVNLNEALTELLATVLHNYAIDKDIRDELPFSLDVCRRLRSHFSNTWKQTTHAFSYYYVKTILLAYLLGESDDIYDLLECASKFDKIKEQSLRMTKHDVMWNKYYKIT
jgi:hypothetical protein